MGKNAWRCTIRDRKTGTLPYRASPISKNAIQMLSFLKVSKTFRNDEVLSSVSFDVSAGSLVGLIGANGAGKTTILRLAAGILRPSSGTVSAFGENPYRSRVRVGGRIGALLEKPGHYMSESVRKNLSFFYSFYVAKSALAAAVDDALERFGLGEVEDEPMGTLSLGYRHRVALARACHPGAELLLLDEPFDSLDPATRTSFKILLRAVRDNGCAILMSSHDLRDVSELCDAAIVLADRHAEYTLDVRDVVRLGILVANTRNAETSLRARKPPALAVFAGAPPL